MLRIGRPCTARAEVEAHARGESSRCRTVFVAVEIRARRDRAPARCASRRAGRAPLRAATESAMSGIVALASRARAPPRLDLEHRGARCASTAPSVTATPSSAKPSGASLAGGSAIGCVLRAPAADALTNAPPPTSPAVARLRTEKNGLKSPSANRRSPASGRSARGAPSGHVKPTERVIGARSSGARRRPACSPRARRARSPGMHQEVLGARRAARGRRRVVEAEHQERDATGDRRTRCRPRDADTRAAGRSRGPSPAARPWDPASARPPSAACRCCGDSHASDGRAHEGREPARWPARRGSRSDGERSR
jgi:hypothetical protein